jgi:hypothetical protein
MREEDAARIEVGGGYLIALVRYRGGWGPLAYGSVAALSGGPVATTDSQRGVGNQLARELAKLPLDEVRVRLESAPRNPTVEQYRSLRPEQRRKMAENLPFEL